MQQQTVREEIVFEGPGIHTGTLVRLVVKPAGVDYGIRFRRTDSDHGEAIPARIEHVGQSALTGRQTTLGDNGSRIVTIEHLMAVFHALGVDNALVEVNGGEVPALDGSAKNFADAIVQTGLLSQPAERHYLTVTEPVYFQKDEVAAAALPSDDFRISYTLSYGGQDIHDQYISLKITPEVFLHEIASARTFCVKKEVEALLAQGYGRGASLDNTLVFDQGEPIQNELRFPDEAVRHKVLDLIGDLYLTGYPLKAHVVAIRTGHAQNRELVKRLIKYRSQSRFSSTGEDMKRKPSKELDITEIKKIIPHRHPFLWVDKIVELEPGKRAVGIKHVTIDDYFFEGHFPGHPIMPGVLIIEAMAQVGAVAMMCIPENRGKIAYFMSIDQAKFRKPVFPGSELRMEIEILKAKARIGQCRGVATVNGEVVCEAEVKFAFVKETQDASGGMPEP